MTKKVSTLNESHPTDCKVLIKVRSDYADWNVAFDHGYIRYWRSFNSRLERHYEHKLVIEHVHGQITKGKHVHHKSGIKTNNSADNLSVVSPLAHAHAHGRIRIYIDTTCAHCGKPVKADKTRLQKSEFIYCDQVCAHEGQKPVVWPTSSELLQLIEEIQSIKGIADRFGVVDNTVRGWMISYDIDPKICDGRKLHPFKQMHHKKSKYKGVFKKNGRNRWYARIHLNGKMTHVGTFASEEDAAKGYDAAVKEHFGPGAYLNYPE